MILVTIRGVLDVLPGARDGSSQNPRRAQLARADEVIA
jgi:hypothetical protein